ncbi:MAG: histidinol-phosphatase [Actinomycetota bacterium]|nr:histidinol-phosphatase [Actinomycetota bacterium]
MGPDLALAFHLADLADAMTLRWWSRNGVASAAKADGSPVTEADVAAEEAVLSAVREACPGDGFLGEEVGERLGTTGRRWIVDGIDGTRFFAAGLAEWGSLIALESDGEIVLGVTSSPAQDRRWWATRGEGAFTGRSRNRSTVTRIHVSTAGGFRPGRFITLPAHGALSVHRQQIIEQLAGGPPADHPWSHANRIAEGQADVCVWFCGDIWDHAAPSILVEEAGGRFSDHWGGRRLDTRTAIYSNGVRHDEVLAALAPS